MIFWIIKTQIARKQAKALLPKMTNMSSTNLLWHHTWRWNVLTKTKSTSMKNRLVSGAAQLKPVLIPINCTNQCLALVFWLLYEAICPRKIRRNNIIKLSMKTPHLKKTTVVIGRRSALLRVERMLTHDPGPCWGRVSLHQNCQCLI